MWKALLQQLNQNNSFANIQSPATKEEVENISLVLHCTLPNDLINFLQEANGDNDRFFSATKIIRTNCRLRESELSNSVDNILFFAGNGCGDYYGFCDGSIYMWNHETEQRKFVAATLKDFINFLNSEDA